MDVGGWLRKLGLEQYEPAFRENKIDSKILPRLTAEDLKDLGIALVGDRRRLLEAIASLRDRATSPGKGIARLGASVRGDSGGPPGSDAERRQLTVMLCDLVGSTALCARLDPEDMREIIGAFRRCCAEAITKAGGFVAKYMGDGVLAYFGYPQAHEDDAERAIRSALTLVDTVRKLQAGDGASLQVRIGMATGLVVVGDLIGEGVAQEHGVVGDTPNLAARLQALAEPGQVVISPATRRLTGGLFEYRDLGRVALKGLGDPVQAWQVTAAGTVRSRFEAQHEANLTPLVGRGEELELLLRRWHQAKSGEGQVVLLSGEPGIGKSRLTVALEERLQGEPHTLMRYFCSPHHTDSALYPTITQLERAAGFERDDTPQTKLDKLTLLLDPSARHENDIRLLSELLSIPTGDRYAPLNWSPQRKREKTFDALLRQLQMLSRQRPLFVVYEDAHWIDPSSRELLDMTVDRVASLPVLLIIAFRPEFLPPWTGQADVSTLTLSRLRRREGAELVERVAGNNALPPEIKAEIVERTDGIPLFVEELTKAVLGAGPNDENATKSGSTAPLPALAVPATLHASLMARLDRLGPVARETAQVAAAIGREFSYELIRAVADRSDDALHAALDQLVDAGLVFRRGSLPEATFLFKHALVQDAAYGTLLKGPRQHLHRRIARMLEERLPDHASVHPELVASHYAQAGDSAKAIDYWDKAGRLAVARSTMAEAAVHFSKALQLVSSLPKGAQRHTRELTLQLALAGTLMAAKGWASPQAGEAYAHARELCREAPEGPQLVAALSGVATFLHNRAEFAAARQVAEELLAAAGRLNDRDARLLAQRAYGLNLLFRAEFADALRHFKDAANLYERPGDSSLRSPPVDPRVACQSFIPWTLLVLGYADEAVAQSRPTLAYARELSHPYTLGFALHVNCIFHQLRGDGTILRERSKELVALATEQGFPHFVGSGTCFRGWAAIAQGGSIEDAISEIRYGLATKRATGAEIKVPYYLGLLAEAHRRINRATDGLNLLSEALELTERTGERWYEAELYRLMGAMLISNADQPGAEPWFSRALATARKQHAKLFELRASASLARLWRDQGKRTEARKLLASIYAQFTEGFDTPDLAEAKALLDMLK